MNLNFKKKGVDKVINHRYFEQFIKVGLYTRGFLYLMIGYLALSFDLYGETKIVDMKGVIKTIYYLPGGVYLVLIITIGLASLFIWGVLRAIYSPYDKKWRFQGIMSRSGNLLGGITYLIFCISTFSLIIEFSNLNTKEVVLNPILNLLLQPWGELICRVLGGILIIVSIMQLKNTLQFKFISEIEIDFFNKFVRLAIIFVGITGFISRSIVYSVIGYLFIWAASIVNNKNDISGTEDALNLIYQLPDGKTLLGIIAIGLIMFGVYSLIAGWKLKYLND